MNQVAEYTKHGFPLFDGQNYAFWSTRMKLFLQSQGLEVWLVTKHGYTPNLYEEEPTDPAERKAFVCNSKAMCAILGGLTGEDFVKVMHCTTAKAMWDKLRNIYEGDVKVRKAKLQTHRSKFEQLKMKDDEDIAGYLLRVDDVVNTMIGLGEEIKESNVVEKILRSLPSRFDSKVSAIEEMKDFDKLSKDELHGILTAYEMRTDQGNPSKGEAAVGY
jgi:hypothetical protein